MHLVKMQITLYSWYIIMKYRHVRRPPHSVENPNTVDPQWIILYWGSKWNLHTVCWGAVGCEWGTTTEAQRYHCKYNLTAVSIILPPRDLFYRRKIYFTAASFIFTVVSFMLLPRVLFYCHKIYFTATSFNFTAASFYPRPVLVFGYCRCLRRSVCVGVNHGFVHAITCHLFKLESPNLNQKCKTPWLRSLLFCWVIVLDLQGQI